MERIRTLLEEQVNENLIQMILSNPRNRQQVLKIKVRPVLLKEKLQYQVSRYIDTKVLHQNLCKEELIDQIIEEMELQFGQLQLYHTQIQATAIVGKKGTVTIKCKKRHKVEIPAAVNSHNRVKDYILKENIPVPFLIDLGIQTKDGRTVQSKYDKFRQINRFLEFIKDILPSLPKNKRITILDFGCGKSYLTFAMYYYLKIMNEYDIDIVGLDLKKDVIETCNRLKEKYGYENLVFLQGDIKEYCEKEEVDMVVTLHACDTATDYALYKVVSWNAKVILSVPCCQHELGSQIDSEILEPILKYGILKERMSALMTDGIRANLLEQAGYDTQLLEFIDMEHTPKNILIRAVRKEGIRKKQYEALSKLEKELGCELTLEKLLNGKRT